MNMNEVRTLTQFQQQQIWSHKPNFNAIAKARMRPFTTGGYGKDVYAEHRKGSRRRQKMDEQMSGQAFSNGMPGQFDDVSHGPTRTTE